MKRKFAGAVCAETYANYERMLLKLVNGFIRKYKGDRDEAMGIARLAFMQAYHNYDYRQALFSTWLYWKTWSRLMDWKRRDACRAANVTFVSIDASRDEDSGSLSDILPSNNGFDRKRLLARMQPDARLLVKMALDAPGEIKTAHGTVKTRMAMKERLREMGWAATEIRKAFKEVRSVLSDVFTPELSWMRSVVEELDIAPAESFATPKKYEPKMSTNEVCEADLLGKPFACGMCR